MTGLRRSLDFQEKQTAVALAESIVGLQPDMVAEIATADEKLEFIKASSALTNMEADKLTAQYGATILPATAGVWWTGNLRVLARICDMIGFGTEADIESLAARLRADGWFIAWRLPETEKRHATIGFAKDGTNAAIILQHLQGAK